MTFKYNQVEAFKEYNGKKLTGRVIARVRVEGPNNFKKYVERDTIQKLEETLHKEFGLKLKEKDLKKIERQCVDICLYGGVNNRKKYQMNKKNMEIYHEKK